jgi:hypothetical protein
LPDLEIDLDGRTETIEWGSSTPPTEDQIRRIIADIRKGRRSKAPVGIAAAAGAIAGGRKHMGDPLSRGVSQIGGAVLGATGHVKAKPADLSAGRHPITGSGGGGGGENPGWAPGDLKGYEQDKIARESIKKGIDDIQRGFGEGVGAPIQWVIDKVGQLALGPGWNPEVGKSVGHAVKGAASDLSGVVLDPARMVMGVGDEGTALRVGLDVVAGPLTHALSPVAKNIVRKIVRPGERAAEKAASRSVSSKLAREATEGTAFATEAGKAPPKPKGPYETIVSEGPGYNRTRRSTERMSQAAATRGEDAALRMKPEQYVEANWKTVAEQDLASVKELLKDPSVSRNQRKKLLQIRDGLKTAIAEGKIPEPIAADLRRQHQAILERASRTNPGTIEPITPKPPRKHLADPQNPPKGAIPDNQPPPAVAPPEAPATPKRRPNAKPEPPVQNTVPPTSQATGLANQVQEREIADGVLQNVESAGGHNAEYWHGVGKKAVDEGADYEGLASKIRSGEVDINPERIGILLEGKRILRNEVDRLAGALKEKPGDKELVIQYEAARDRLQTYAENVQAGKGQWSDVGRALQAGTTLNEGSFAEVLEEAGRHGAVSQKLEGQLGDYSAEVAARDAKIKRLEKDLEAARTKSAPKPKRTFDRQTISQEIEDIFEEFKKLQGGGIGKNKQRGAVSPPGPEDFSTAIARGKLLGRLAKNYAKLYVGAPLEDVVVAVRNAVQERLGIEIDDQEIIDAIALPEGSRTRPEIEKQMAQLRSQARRESSLAKAAKDAAEKKRYEKTIRELEDTIKDLKNQLFSGNYRTPTKREVAIVKEISELRAERDVWAGKVRSAIRNHSLSTATKIVRGTAGFLRGTQLGSDIGALTRQGLFAWSHPATALKATGKGVGSMFSEKAFARTERELMERKVAGRSVAPIRKAAGLQMTDSISHPEEISIGHLLKMLPWIGKYVGGAYERFQLTFLNSIRADLFDHAYAMGMNESELKLRANFINSATGRGNVKHVPEYLNLILTSPRYEASRWEMIWHGIKNPAVLASSIAKGKPNLAAWANVKDMAVTAGEVLMLFKTAELAGYSVDFDPTSADFLKLRKGNEVWDVSAGLAPRLRDLLRVAIGFKDPDFKQNLKNSLGEGWVRTISPAIRTPANMASAKMQRADGIEEPKSLFTGVPMDPQDESLWALAPLVYQTMVKGLGEGGLEEALSVGLKEFIGQGVNFYPEPAKKGPSKPTKPRRKHMRD